MSKPIQMIQTEINLISDFIDAEIIIELLNENYTDYYHTENDECVNRIKSNIKKLEVELQKYLTILN